MIINSTISYAVNGKQYVMVFTGAEQSATTGPIGLDREGHAASCVGTQRDLRFFAALVTHSASGDPYLGASRHPLPSDEMFPILPSKSSQPDK